MQYTAMCPWTSTCEVVNHATNALTRQGGVPRTRRAPRRNSIKPGSWSRICAGRRRLIQGRCDHDVEDIYRLTSCKRDTFHPADVVLDLGLGSRLQGYAKLAGSTSRFIFSIFVPSFSRAMSGQAGANDGTVVEMHVFIGLCAIAARS